MNLSVMDMAVIAAVAGTLAFPQAKKFFLAVASKVKKGPEEVSAQQWQSEWTTRLIDLKNQIDSGEWEVPNDKEASRLCSALIWELIGGEEE